MSVIQHQFPLLWKVFQYCLGGTVDKRKLALEFYSSQKNVLEVGCSLGNISKSFADKDCSYLGIDIDEKVIQLARKTFKVYPNLKFDCMNLLQMDESQRKFDYILFAGVCHHIEDELLIQMLRKACALLEEKGQLIIYDPLRVENKGWLIDLYQKMDEGEQIRSEKQFAQIMRNVPDLQLTNYLICPVGATPFSKPVVAHFILAKFQKPGSQTHEFNK